jgi:hypothetical protein
MEGGTKEEDNNIEDNNIEEKDDEDNHNLDGGSKTKSIENIPNININDIEFNIDYIIESDEKLIDVERIKNKVNEYIDNYYSDTMEKYKLNFNKLYQKYSNKNYIIKTLPVKDKYNSTKIIVIKNDKKETKISEIIKPHYIYYDNNSNLYNFKNRISNERAELLYKYEILVSQLNISIEDKNKFEKEKETFVKLLEEYYIYTLYHKKINKISTFNTIKLLINSKYYININNNDDDDKVLVLSGDIYNIDNKIIDEINTYNINNLTKYNNIILELSGKSKINNKKDSKLIEEIKLYLDKKEKEQILKKLENNKSIQDEYINYIVSKLPIIS